MVFKSKVQVISNEDVTPDLSGRCFMIIHWFHVVASRKDRIMIVSNTKGGFSCFKNVLKPKIMKFLIFPTWQVSRVERKNCCISKWKKKSLVLNIVFHCQIIAFEKREVMFCKIVSTLLSKCFQTKIMISSRSCKRNHCSITSNRSFLPIV